MFSPPTAMQVDADRLETELSRLEAAGTGTGTVIQFDPFQRSASATWPLSVKRVSTAVQVEVDVHDTEVRLVPPTVPAGSQAG